jgi:hypothetical protein
MSDQMKNVPIASTTVAIITGTNSRRSSLRDIFLTRYRSSHLFAGIDFEIVNGGNLNGRSRTTPGAREYKPRFCESGWAGLEPFRF